MDPIPTEKPKACPFLPPIMMKDGLGRPVANLNPCLKENCECYSITRGTCGLKQFDIRS